MRIDELGPWTLLVIAGVLETVWALGFKYVRDDSPFVLHAVVYVALILSFVLLVAALRSLPAGTAYAVWTGIGATGVAILGMVFFGEPVSVTRIALIALVVIGIVGLRLTHSDPPPDTDPSPHRTTRTSSVRSSSPTSVMRSAVLAKRAI